MSVEEETMLLDPARAALLITDPQSDLGPRHPPSGVIGRGVARGTTGANLERLLEAARRANMVIAAAPHYCDPDDLRWGFGSFLPECRPHFLGGRTIIAAPHRTTPADDHVLDAQLRCYGVRQVVLVGTWANVCREGYLRGLLARGFEVAVVGNDTAVGVAAALRAAPQAA
jgi:nicotinamidase-related amidase